MTKRDIVSKISQEKGIKPTVVKVVVQGVFDTIIDALSKNRTIEIRNFGVFKVKKRRRRIGRNPRTGEVVPIPERKVVIFKPGLEMKKSIR